MGLKPINNDLISRAAAIEEINPLLYSGDFVSALIHMPTIDAIPVEWLEEQRDELSEAWDIEWHVINGLIEQWREEQETSDENDI